MDVDELCVVIAHLLKEVNPRIDEDSAFELVLEMLTEHDTLDETIVAFYGQAIGQSSNPGERVTH